MQNGILFFIIIISFLSCRKEKNQNIPIEFTLFVERFFEEANEHNVDISLIDFNLDIKFAELDGQAGTCSTKNNKIEIDENEWLNSTFAQKEWLIFHELGHCVLERSHNNNKTSSGECLSFMNERIGNPECSTNLCSSLWRQYYIDELFNECQNLHSWYLESQQYNSFEESNRIYQIDTTIISSSFSDSIEFGFENDFVIEMKFYDWVQKTNSVFIMWGNNNSFSYCKNCTVSNLSISLNQKRVFYNTFEDEDDTTKLTIEKIDNQYRFFYNEQFMHTYEFTEWEDNSIRTFLIGEEIAKDVIVYFIEN